MNISILGASAGVGLAATRLALERGHQVTTLSRSTESLTTNASLRVVQGSALAVADVRAAALGAQAVIVALGTGNSTKATGMYEASARVLLRAIDELQTRPTLLVLTGFGAGASWNYNRWYMKLLFNLLLKDVYADKTAAENLFTSAYDRCTMVRPGRLIDGPATGHYRVLPELRRGMKVGAISRADVAHFLVTQAERPEYLGRNPALTL